MPPHDMKYIGFKHQRENKQNSDKYMYSSIFINKYIAKACMELSVILIIEHCIKVIKKKFSEICYWC
jgi:hypothetical protein